MNYDEEEIPQHELDEYCDDYNNWVDFELVTLGVV